MAGAHLTLLPTLIKKLNAFKEENFKAKKIHVVAGGVFPQAYLIQLQNEGVSAVFSPGTKIIMILNKLVELYNLQATF